MQHLQSITLGSDTPTSSETEYRPALATVELIFEVKRLLATERRVERLICLYLADMADRIRQGQDNALWAYADEFHAARCFFGLGVRETRERVRVGRALRQMPQVEAAFVSGELSYSRVREVTCVATPQTECDWLELARTLDMRALERRVAGAREASVGTSEGDGAERAPTNGSEGIGSGRGEQWHEPPMMDQPARTAWLSQSSLRVTFELSAEAWALLERALEGARRSGAGAMSDAEALVAVARDALAAQTREHDASDPRRSGVLAAPRQERSGRLDGPRSAPARAGAPGSEAGQDIGWGATQVGISPEPAAHLLQVIGRRGGWSLDALIERTGLSASAVSVALTLLEVGGRVRYHDFLFDPV